MKAIQGALQSACFLFALSQLADSFSQSELALSQLLTSFGNAPFRPHRTTVSPRMQVGSEGTWPPPLDAVHVFDVTIAGVKEKQRLVLTQIPTEKNRPVLALWKFAYAHEMGGGEERLARADSELRAELALAVESSVFGVYLNGVDGDEHGLALIRFERDAMNIDTVLVSPRIPPQMRPQLQEAVVESLTALGEANGMTVRLFAPR
mmetsp:Transcript_41744/g.73417  ORF Transcript_41744/g.73417 Transcript_41744/m.73417 type:complete len:206 (+) Transcript_41744:97-714(+)